MQRYVLISLSVLAVSLTALIPLLNERGYRIGGNAFKAEVRQAGSRKMIRWDFGSGTSSGTDENGPEDLTFRTSGASPASRPSRVRGSSIFLNAGGGAEDLACSDSGFPHGNQARTAGAWVKTKSTTQPAFFDYGNEAPHERFTLLVSLKGKFMFASVGDDFEAATAVNNGRWHFLAATYDGKQANLYVDGNLDGSRKFNLKTTSNGSAVIGSVRGETAFFTGMIHSPFISNYALSPREIRDLAKNSPRD